MLNSFKIGHYSDEINGTGATVILAEKGAVAGASIRGAAPATRETELLHNGKKVGKINAVVLSGGSAFGLEAACGVMEYLREKNLGYDAGKFAVPIVVGASLYDLEYKSFAYPDKKNGYDACINATQNNFSQGAIGAACGATISKALGMDYAVKTSLGVRLYSLNDLEIAVIVAVNALGDVIKDGEIIGGARLENGEYIDCEKILTLGKNSYKNQNTTIGCIITNAELTKEEANILASLSHDGLAQSIRPPHTMFDGDAMFVMTDSSVKAEFNMLATLVPRLTADAIRNSVTENPTIGTQNRVNGILYKLYKRFFK